MVGAILAGGLGRRMGGRKPTAPLGGRPLIAWPLAAVRAAGLDPVVVVKDPAELPALDAPVLVEGAARRHPFAGVVAAVERHGEVVVVGADMPFLEPALLRALAAAPGVVAAAGPPLQPLCARYGPEVLESLRAALANEAPMRATLAALSPTLVAADPAGLVNVNSPQELAAAEARLRRTPPSPR